MSKYFYLKNKLKTRYNERGVVGVVKLGQRILARKILFFLLQYPRIIKYKLLSNATVFGRPVINQPTLMLTDRLFNSSEEKKKGGGNYW